MDLNLKNKVILVLLLIFTTSGFSQNRERVEFNVDGLYKGVYSEVLQQPLWVAYTVKCPNGQASRKGMNFFVPVNIKTSDDLDYANNIYDKGHMAPAAAFSCNRGMLLKTFSYLNSALQHQGLNRGQWNQLESFERDLANFYTVRVHIRVLFEGKQNRLKTGAVIPSGFIKTLIFDNKKIIFKFPNKDTKGTDWIDYKIN